MPPKRSAADATSSSAPEWLSAILTRLDSYFERFDKMFEIVLNMPASQFAILERISALEHKVVCSAKCEMNTRPALYSTLVKFQADSRLVDEKSCRVTWVGIEEKDSEAETILFDREAIKEVIEASGDSELLDEFNRGSIEHHRHPQLRRSSRPWIIKISLRNKDLRDRLLAHMRAERQSLTKNFGHSYARRVYTREELDYDRQLRKKAGAMNSQAGKLMFVVRDLTIHQLREPKDLPKNDQKRARFGTPSTQTLRWQWFDPTVLFALGGGRFE
ncbi:unnamed protein product [Nippostrongylus brasiliensis]|uniref:Uncharacterized protein n=1 Tax=Nippostrongylus brasiliensis TaxID=27835 RepID=A0A0N4XIB2_NIPBR|nr:unnamed protein product [Nippostrongylus brasiliensis]